MNKQEVFKIVADHLMKQKEKSEVKLDEAHSYLSCAYRGTNGKSCAVGCLIKDEFYHPDFENMRVSAESVQDALINSIGTLTAGVLLLLSNLQQVHDSKEVVDWQRALENLARQHNIDWTAS